MKDGEAREFDPQYAEQSSHHQAARLGKKNAVGEMSNNTCDKFARIMKELDECFLAGALDQEDTEVMKVVDKLWTKDIVKVGQLRELSLREAFKGLDLGPCEIQYFQDKVRHLGLE